MPLPKQQFIGSNGRPLAGGKVYTYSTGTTTPKATYTTSAGTVANTNPVILDSAGRASIWLNGFYTIAVYDANDVLQYTQDNVSAMAYEPTIDAFIERIGTIGKIKARAYRNAAQNIVPGPTKILIDTISRDTESVIDIANSRIIPNLPGDYVVMGNVMASDVPDGRLVNAMIYKNSVWVSYGTIDNQGAAGRSSSIASDLIYMDGKTDYLELFAHNSHSSALALYTGNSYQNYISILGPF
jgi:hypothetical protein